MKFDIHEIYHDRVEEIDKQAKECVHRKQWGKLKQLRDEKKRIQEQLNEMR